MVLQAPDSTPCWVFLWCTWPTLHGSWFPRALGWPNFVIAGIFAAQASAGFHESVETLAAGGDEWTVRQGHGPAAYWLATRGATRMAPGPQRDPRLDRRGLALAWEGILHARPGNPAVAADGNPPFEEQVSACYAAHGEGLLDHLVGDYAFALWDGHAGRLLLATDPFAQRSMYYALHPAERMIAFASHTRALRALSWVGNFMDEESVVDLLSGYPWAPCRTPYRHIRFLPAGHCLRWHVKNPRDDLVPSRYWGPHFPATMVRSRQEFLTAFEATARLAVAQRLSAGGGSGTAILMGGGFDSTAIAGMAAALQRTHSAQIAPVQTVSGTFDTLPCDESGRIEAVLAHAGLRGTLVPALHHPLGIAAIERQVRETDFPLFNLQDPLLQAELDAARRAGADTVLTGIGGDELADDRSHVHDLLDQRGVRHLWGVARSMGELHGGSTNRIAWSLAKSSMPDFVGRPLRYIRRLPTRRQLDPCSAWLQPGWRQTVAERSARSSSGAHASPKAQHSAAEFGSHFQRQMWGHLEGSEAGFGRRATTAQILRRGFQAGSPFLDRRLFELIFGTEARWMPRRHESGQYKPIFASALANYYPPEFTRTPWKVEFGSYNRSQMRQCVPELSGWLLESGAWKSERFVAIETARQVLTQFRVMYDRGDASADVYHRRLYRIVGVEAWMRQI